jgi:hypothetical protein
VQANLDRLRAALVQLTRGVLALHRSGVVHRDLKPSNVVVTSSGRLIVLDFGIARGIGLGSADVTELVGTPEFMAPEQALLGLPDPASDWYSVGVMLFDALVGRPPLAGSAEHVLEAKLTMDAPRPSALVNGVPQELDDLCAALLDRDPQRRPSGSDIIRVLGGQESLRPAIIDTRSHAAAELVGRDRHLARLRDGFARVSEGHIAGARVTGAPGMGKSRLLARFADELTSNGDAVVLSTRVLEEETIPYKALDGVVDGLCRHLMALETRGHAVPTSESTEALARLFPILKRVRTIAESRDAPRDDPMRVRQLAIEGFRELLRFAAGGLPLVLSIDDAQWGDADSVSLLVELIRPPCTTKIFLLLGHRDVAAEGDHFVEELLKRWPADVSLIDIPLEPLTLAEVRALFLAELGSQDEAANAAADAISEEVAGNPLLVMELATSARLEASRTQGTPTRSAPASFDRLVQERLADVHADVRRVLELVAVSGRPIRTETLGAAALMSDSLEPSIAILGQRRLLRVARARGHEVLETCHDRIRESVLARLSPADIRAHHTSLARAIVQASALEADALVRHWSGAGVAERTSESAVQAAELAAQKLAFKRSEAFYRLALENLAPDSADAKLVRRRLAEVLEWDGRGLDAAQVYREAVAHASGIERSELESAAAMQLLCTGQVAEGVALLRRSLQSLDLRVPSSTGSALFWLAVYRARLSIVVPRQAARVAPSVVGSLARARVEALYNAAFGMVFIDPLLGESMQSQHILTALKEGDRLQQARALALEASHCAREPGPKAAARAASLFEAAEALAQSSGDAGCAAFVRACRGVSEFLRGRFLDAQRLLEGVYQDVPQHRAGWHTNAWIYEMFSLVNMGSFEEVAKKLPSLLRGAEHRSDRFTATSLRVAAQTPLLLAQDQPEEAAEQLRAAMSGWQSPRFLLQHWRHLYFSCEVDLYRDRADVALARLREAEPKFARSGLRRVQYIRGMSRFLLIRAIIAAGIARRKLDGAEVDRNIAELEAEGTDWTSTLAAMARGARALATTDGARAVDELTLAAELAERAQMLAHAGASRLQLARALGDAGKDQQRSAEQNLQALGVRNALKYAMALVPSRRAEG